MRIAKLCMVIAFLAMNTTAASEDLFSIRIVSHPSALPLGIPMQVYNTKGPVEGWIKTHMTVVVSYKGNDALPIVPSYFPGYWDGRGVFSIFAEVFDQSGLKLAPCPPEAFADDVILGAPKLSPGWSERLEAPVCVPGVGTYKVRVVAEQTRGSFTNIQGDTLALWTGREVSDSVSVEVTEPAGTDRQAYEAFDRKPLGNSERNGELLSRFPTSTYAAYVVWSKYSKGWAAVETDRAVDVLALGFKHEKGLAPCDAKLRPIGDAESRLSGASYVQCRDAWLKSVLTHHSEAWFADEIRLRLALDQYLLGENATCAAQLEGLSKQARVDVAIKASEILAALKEKGMLKPKMRDSHRRSAPSPCAPARRRMLDIPPGMPALFRSTGASSSWHISSGRTAHLRSVLPAPRIPTLQ